MCFGTVAAIQCVEVKNCLKASFHLTQDVKIAISKGSVILFSIYGLNIF
jgi:hypothetical protein